MPSGLTMLTSQPTITIAAPNATFRSFLLNFAQISPTRHDLLDCVRRRLPLGAAPRQGTRAGNPRTVVPVHRRTADTRPVSTPRDWDAATYDSAPGKLAAQLGSRACPPRRGAADTWGRHRPRSAAARRRRDGARRRLRLR